MRSQFGFGTLLLVACSPHACTREPTPTVTAAPTFEVLQAIDVEFGQGLGFSANGDTPAPVSLKLDVYYPDNSATDRPIFVFVHGGGFIRGIKSMPEIVSVANYFASRGWVFASIDYRTVAAMGAPSGLTREQAVAYYAGIAPREWVEFGYEGAETPTEFLQSVAMYAAQRDAKAAVRWMASNAETYRGNTDFISVGGASAGAITAITLGITDLDDFRDELLANDDPTLASTHLDQAFSVRSLVYFWGSTVQLGLFEEIYGVDPYDSGDPELFMAHGTDDPTPGTTFSEATKLKGICDGLGVYSELVRLEGAGHGAWDAEVDGKGLSERSFDFLVARQGLKVED